jgi:hypothetical protein
MSLIKSLSKCLEWLPIQMNLEVLNELELIPSLIEMMNRSGICSEQPLNGKTKLKEPWAERIC